MFDIVKKEIFEFSMLNLVKNETIYFKDLEELLSFLAKRQSHWVDFCNPEDSFKNEYLDCLNLTGYDRYFFETWNTQTKTFDVSSKLKPYMFFDKDGNFYDVRIHHRNLVKRSKELWWERKYSRMPKYTFRRGPVPGTGVHYRGHFLRHMKTTNELRANSIPEYKEYIRAKRKKGNLPTVYDDIPICRQRSWKEKTKERHQWAKHFNGSKVPDKYSLSDFFNYDEEE